jgi:2-polyprenyl-6-methoxyphenol hydroxylase-like FAD-dependent oxidoreductase
MGGLISRAVPCTLAVGALQCSHRQCRPAAAPRNRAVTAAALAPAPIAATLAGHPHRKPVMDHSLDVLVVGAGPVGLTMAAELARYGLSVRIIDKSAARTDKSKALVLWSRSLELIGRMGCAEKFIAAGVRVTAANVMAGPRRIAHMTLSGLATPHPYALMIPQNETERLMEEHLANLSIQVERQVELLNFTQGPDTVTAVLRHTNGQEETLAAAWLIGCDGAHSTVRHGLGMDFEGDTLPSDWALADVHLAGAVPPENELAMFWHTDGVLALFPISPGRFRIIADIGNQGGGALRPDPTLQEMQVLLDLRGPGGITASAPIWLSAFRINERKIANYRAGRVFLAGDAAHIHSPAGGQGMNTGMQDAINLAWKLALVQRGLAGAVLLDSYSAERSEIGRKVLKNAGRLTSVAMVKGEFAQSIRNRLVNLLTRLPPVRTAFANGLAELSIAYPNSKLTRAGNHGLTGPAPGARAPLRDTANPVGAGTTPRFAFFAQPDAAAAPVIARYPDLLEPALRPPFDPAGIWLVRPDEYVAMVARLGGWADIEGYLQAAVRGK